MISLKVLRRVSSCLSGTRAQRILSNKPSSLMKKKAMNTTENTATTMSMTSDATEPTRPLTWLKLTSSLSLPNTTAVMSKSAPTSGNKPMIHSFTFSMGLELNCALSLMAEASRTMLETKGTICVKSKTSKARISTMVKMAKSQLGALFPLMRIFFKSCMKGRPIMETTKATMM